MLSLSHPMGEGRGEGFSGEHFEKRSNFIGLTKRRDFGVLARKSPLTTDHLCPTCKMARARRCKAPARSLTFLETPAEFTRALVPPGGINPSGSIASECMSKPIVTVTPDMSIEECCRIMEEKQIRRVPVVDERGSCCGIVALADIARHTQKTVAGEVVKEVSQPTAASASAS